MKIVMLDQIQTVLEKLDLMTAIESGFDAYSTGQAEIPPVGELLLEGGDVHIKYGYLKSDEYYVIKIASGFYENPRLGIPSGNGLMLLFRQKTGELESILLDEGRLTDIRTAVAGAIAAKYLAPRSVERIGIVGTGTQGKLQLRYLREISPCKDVLVWGRSQEALQDYISALSPDGFHIETTLDSREVLRSCNLVVTCTPSPKPLLFSSELRPGTHITAVGSDTPGKQELDASILGKADLVVADSIRQCTVRGEISQAIKAGEILEDQLVELGDIIGGRAPGRKSEAQTTVADLTGVAVQDIKIAAAVYGALMSD